jgi:outer membrane lipoprotein
MKLTLLSALAFLLLAGCAHVFSDRANSLVDPFISFEMLKKDPKFYAGKNVKLGGLIASTKNLKDGSQVEVVQFKLGSDDIPDTSYSSGGRFLAVTPNFLDSMIYKSGLPVALIGEVQGEKTLPLDETEYSYPVISITEIHVWPIYQAYPYPSPYYYDPFFYNYWWSGPPYWYPYGYPYGPRFRRW